MLENELIKYFLNVLTFFDVMVLQLLFSKYMESFHILYISQTIYLLHW